jgi:transcriptional regulator with XRE-family HTH domain
MSLFPRVNLSIYDFMLDILSYVNYSGAMVGNRLQEVLKREKVSVYRLWKDLGIDQGQISRFFHGKQGLSMDKIEQIADYLDYDIVFVKRKSSRKGVK